MADWFARSTTIFYLFSMFLFDNYHSISFYVILVQNQFQNVIWACFDTFVAPVAFVSVNNDEVISGAIFVTIMSLHGIMSPREFSVVQEPSPVTLGQTELRLSHLQELDQLLVGAVLH